MLAQQDPQERRVYKELQDLLVLRERRALLVLQGRQERKEFKVLVVLQDLLERKEMLDLLARQARPQQLLDQRDQQERHQR